MIRNKINKFQYFKKKDFFFIQAKILLAKRTKWFFFKNHFIKYYKLKKKKKIEISIEEPIKRKVVRNIESKIKKKGITVHKTNKKKKILTRRIIRKNKYFIIHKIKKLREKILKKQKYRERKLKAVQKFSFNYLHSRKLVIACSLFRWKKARFFFKNNFKIKKHFKLVYFNLLGTKNLRRLLYYKKTEATVPYNRVFIKPEMRIDIFLWRNGFCLTPLLVKDFLRKRIVFLNNKSAHSIREVKAGCLLHLIFNKTIHYKCYLQKIRTIYIGKSLYSYYPLYAQKDSYLLTLKVLYDYTSFKLKDQIRIIHSPISLYNLKK